MQRNRGQIIEKGHRKWLVRTYVGRDANGKRQYASKTVEGTYKQAERFLTELQGQVDTGARGVRSEPRMTVQQLLEKFFQAKAAEVTPRTLRSYRDRIERDAYPAIGACRLDNLSPVRIQHLVNVLSRTHSPRTVRYTYTLLRGALKQATEWGLISRSPCIGIKLPRKIKRQATYLTVEEAQRLLNLNSPDACMWTLALTTGLRPEEYAALEWTNVDFERGTLAVVQAITELKAREWILTNDLKSDASRRTVALPDSTIGALKEHRRGTGAIAGFIFRNERGGFLSVDMIRKRWHRDLKRAGITTRARLYDTRHSHATHLLSAGVHPKVVQERLGHSSITITMDTYSHVMPELHRGTAGTVEALMFAKAGTG